MSSSAGFAETKGAPRTRPLAENARLGHYRLLGRLGMGGMGVVYAAVDERVGHKIALKVLLHAHPRAIAAFKREFRALADIHHPNLVVLNELAVVDDQWMLSMELVDGADFLTHVRGSDERLRHSLRQLADGIGALHAAGRVHRDIKPSNVMVTDAGRVVVLDFGLATDLTRPQTEPGRYVMGTIEYIAPERVVVSGRLTQASDWYGVGVILYRALTGRLPFDGDRYDILHRKMEDDPIPPLELRPDVAPDLSSLAMALLRRDPKRRAGRDEIVATVGGNSVSREIRLARPRSVLFGRERHIDGLDDAVDTVRCGRPVVVTVSGP